MLLKMSTILGQDNAKKQIRNPKHEILNKSKIQMSNVPNRKHETRKEKHQQTP